MEDIFVLGFDPIFLDILVLPLDEQNKKLSSFPEIGEHITNTTVKLIPGGNSLNVARILTKLTKNVFFFSAFNSFFLELIHTNIPNLTCKSTTETEPNFTIALQFLSGEIQMNSIKSGFGITDLNVESLYYLTYSRIVPFSNIGLNKNGLLLFEKLVSFFIDLQGYIDNKGTENTSILQFIDDWINKTQSKSLRQLPNDFLKFNLDSLTSISISNKIFYFDPSSLKSFSSWPWLNSFFEKKFSFLPGYKIISLNEFEFDLMIKNKIDFDSFLVVEANNYLIVHETDIITIYTKSLKNKFVISVPKVNSELIISSVGAGDSFNAGVLYEFSKSFNILSAINYGILIAQKFLTNSL